MLANFVGLRHFLVFVILARGELPSRRFHIRPGNCIRTHGEPGKQLLQVLALALRARGDGGLQDQQLELVSAATALIVVNRHTLKERAALPTEFNNMSRLPWCPSHEHQNVSVCKGPWARSSDSAQGSKESVQIDGHIRGIRDEHVGDQGPKNPLISTTTSVAFETNTSTDPLASAGASAALAAICPFQALSVDTEGCGIPVGHIDR